MFGTWTSGIGLPSRCVRFWQLSQEEFAVSGSHIFVGPFFLRINHSGLAIAYKVVSGISQEPFFDILGSENTHASRRIS